MKDLARSGITSAFILSFIIAALIVVASLAGILFQSAVYPTQELRESFVPNDVVNLLIGLPILLGSIGSARRGKLIGLLCLPGALFYVVYNYVAYVFAMPISILSLLYLALVVLSAYTLIRIVVSIAANTMQQRWSGTVPARFSKCVDWLWHTFLSARCRRSSQFTCRGRFWCRRRRPGVTPVWIIGGVMLWRHNTFGYVIGLGLLSQASLLFIGLILFMLLQPLLTTKPFDLAGIVRVFLMGLVCFVPFGLYARGVASQETQGGS